MLKGAGQRKVASYSPVTGLGVVKVVAVNPTNEEYKAIVGRDNPYTLDYKVQENTITKRKEFPVRFLVHCEERNIYDFINFSLSAADDVASTGSIRFIDGKGSMTYSKDLDTIKNNPKMAWFDTNTARVAKAGEFYLYSFLQKLLAYDNKAADANFTTEMDAEGINGATIGIGNQKGLKKLVEWIKENDFAVTVLFTVEKKEKDGKTYDTQRIISNNDELFFYTENKDGKHSVANYSYNILKRLVEGKDKAGKSVEPLKLKGYATYKLQEFKLEDCFNATAPSATPKVEAPAQQWV